MWRSPRSLHWRLALVLLLSELAVTVVVAVAVSAQLRDRREQDALDELGRLVSLLAARYAAPGSVESLLQRVDDDGQATGLRVSVIDADGHVRGDSSFAPDILDSQRYGRGEVEAAVRTGFGSAVRYSPAFEARAAFAARRFTAPDGSLLVVRVGRPLREIHAGAPSAGVAVLAGGGVLLVVTLGVVWLVVRSLGRQVARLRSDASHFAAGELGHRAMAPEARELVPVAEGLNVMARELGSRFERLQLQQKEQQAILQSMSNGVIALDREQRVMNLNRAAATLLGIKPDRAHGRLLQEVVREPELHRFVDEVLEGTADGAVELTIESEPTITVQVVAEKLASTTGEPTGLLVVFNDITQVRRFESLRSDFAANVSHELRTPITNIKGYVETLLVMGWEDKDQATNFLRIIHRNSNRLAAIVEDVMALTKLEQPEAASTFDRERVGVGTLLASVARQFSRPSAERRIRLRTEVAEDLTVLVHSQLIEQAIGNLVANAIAYSPPGTTVIMAAAVRNGSVEISVTDEGPGIPSQHLPRLFERFYRADKARSREMGGTGLGLAIVKHIAIMHGGRAEAESEVGRGSTFRIVLPAGDDPD